MINSYAHSFNEFHFVPAPLKLRLYGTI